MVKTLNSWLPIIREKFNYYYKHRSVAKMTE